jgi:peptide-methionine (R)-S-oxide reductase
LQRRTTNSQARADHPPGRADVHGGCLLIMKLFKSTEHVHSHDDPRYPVHKTDDEWRAQLDPMQYQVARHAATERAFTGKYWDHWENGAYRCVGCGQVLFESEAKFDAGCGWPSWWKEIEPGRIERVVDSSHGMTRVEVRCANCGTHLGHVFEDGPEPSGERYCINSAAIDFDPKA